MFYTLIYARAISLLPVLPLYIRIGHGMGMGRVLHSIRPHTRENPGPCPRPAHGTNTMPKSNTKNYFIKSNALAWHKTVAYFFPCLIILK